MSHGLNLQISHYIIWFTPHPSNETYLQATRRIVRPGQKHVQVIVRLYNCPAEKSTYTSLDKKEDMQGTLMKALFAEED